jgi:DNA (cytosine-5)-methyltransferase 1
MIRVGSDFSGVGAFNQALNRLGIEYKEVFACDMDKYARQTFIHNYGEPEYYPTNVYEREIPKDSLDIYMTSPPCQAFSAAGKRLGKDDKRGILFFNSYEFIQVNKPRYFIFENVKGLLSDDNGRTFSEWVNMLGGKSVNGVPILFPYEESVPYHLYWEVLNSKEHGVPQNRERVFLIGIRDDKDNHFQFPREEHLSKRLKDVLEDEVDEKYFLSDKMIDCLQNYESDKFEVNTEMINNTDLARSLRTEMAKMVRQDNYLKIKKVGFINQDTQASAVYSGNGLSQTMTSGTHGYAMGYVQIKSPTSKGFEEASEGDSINFNISNSETPRIITCNTNLEEIQNTPLIGQNFRIYRNDGLSPSLNSGWVPACNQSVIYKSKRLNKTLEQNTLQIGEVKALDLYNKKVQDNAPTLCEPNHNTTRLWDGYKIRRLTPRECFRLMDFPDTFTWICSDTQAYRQAGNSIVVNVLYKILKKLNL